MVCHGHYSSQKFHLKGWSRFIDFDDSDLAVNYTMWKYSWNEVKEEDVESAMQWESSKKEKVLDWGFLDIVS